MKMKCRFSGQDIPIVHSFGMQPLANGFLPKDFSNEEYFFEMSVAVNLDNALFQLVNQPDPAQMFHDNYAFYSRTSNFMKAHFKDVAIELQGILETDGISSENSFVISCNVGAAIVVSSSASIPAVEADNRKLCPASTTIQQLLDALSRFKLTPLVSSLLVILRYFTFADINLPGATTVPNSNNARTLLASTVTIRWFISLMAFIVNVFVEPISEPLSDIDSVSLTVSVPAVIVLAIS